jgi:hypothetical protein
MEVQVVVRPADREPDGRTRKYQPAAKITAITRMTPIQTPGFRFVFIILFLFVFFTCTLAAGTSARRILFPSVAHSVLGKVSHHYTS